MTKKLISTLRSSFSKMNVRFKKFSKNCEYNYFDIITTKENCKHHEMNYFSDKKCELGRCPRIIYEE